MLASPRIYKAIATLTIAGLSIIGTVFQFATNTQIQPKTITSPLAFPQTSYPLYPAEIEVVTTVTQYELEAPTITVTSTTRTTSTHNTKTNTTPTNSDAKRQRQMISPEPHLLEHTKKSKHETLSDTNNTSNTSKVFTTFFYWIDYPSVVSIILTLLWIPQKIHKFWKKHSKCQQTMQDIIRDFHIREIEQIDHWASENEILKTKLNETSAENIALRSKLHLIMKQTKEYMNAVDILQQENRNYKANISVLETKANNTQLLTTQLERRESEIAKMQERLYESSQGHSIISQNLTQFGIYCMEAQKQSERLANFSARKDIA